MRWKISEQAKTHKIYHLVDPDYGYIKGIASMSKYIGDLEWGAYVWVGKYRRDKTSDSKATIQKWLIGQMRKFGSVGSRPKKPSPIINV